MRSIFKSSTCKYLCVKGVHITIFSLAFLFYFVGDTMNSLAQKRQPPPEVRKLIDEGYNKAKKILSEKIDDLHKLAKALLTYETLTGEEIENLINKNVYPANKEDLKTEVEDQDSALGSIGLKPKIVH